MKRILLTALVAALSRGNPGIADSIWNLSASDGLRIGGYGGNFAYDGTNVVPVEGSLSGQVNATTNQGAVTAVVNGTVFPEDGVSYTGQIRFVFEEFGEGAPWQDGGIVEDILLHGDTGHGPPVMPKIRAYLAGWGTADVYFGDDLAYEDLDTHFMYTERARCDDLTIRKEDGTIYSPTMFAGDYPDFVNQDEFEVHLVAHSTVPDPNNFPAHTVWFHFNWQNATVKPVPEPSTLVLGAGCFLGITMARRRRSRRF